MNKKGLIIAVMVIVIAASVAAYYSSESSDTNTVELWRVYKTTNSTYYSSESSDTNTGRMFGDISTSMGSPILGDMSAPVTIVEFGDYQCHQCYNWFHNTKPSLSQDYIDTGKANLIFVDLAFLGRDSPTAAQATYCAEDQGKYWEYHDLLYVSQESRIDNGWANKERLKAFAFSLGLDMDLFDSCIDSGKYIKRIQYNIGQAQKQEVNGTPTFVIIGPDGQQEKIVGAQPYSVFKQIIDSMV